MADNRSGLAYSQSRKNNFNFLRVLFATLVLLAHAPELIDGDQHREILTRLCGSLTFGGLAVDGFFLLSGYLIVKSWTIQPDPVSFLQKRILRLYPAFIVASIAGALIVGPLGASASDYFAQFSISKFVAGTLFLKPTFTPPVFQGHPHALVNGSMWTVSYEFFCYLLVLVLGTFGALKNKRAWLMMSIVALLADLMRRTIGIDCTGGLKIFLIGTLFSFEPLMRLVPMFLVGGCFYLFLDKIRFTKGRAVFSTIALAVGLNFPAVAETGVAIFGAYLLFYIAHTKHQGTY